MSLITFVVPSAVETSAWIKWLSVSSVGADHAVMMTVAPPRWKRSAIALPAPFVRPVTKTRLPLNSFASNGFVLCLLIRFEVLGRGGRGGRGVGNSHKRSRRQKAKQSQPM